jgi:septum formation protein
MIRKLNDEEINKYLRVCGPKILDSVGCYKIEKNGAIIIEKISGDFFAVMGFPLFPFLVFLKKFNIKK